MPGLSQIISASYPTVLKQLKSDNQFAESALLREFEKQGGVKVVGGAPSIESPLDYRRNPDATTLATDMTASPASLATKTDVISSASYTPSIISVPMVWSKADEVRNASENQKIDLVKSLITNSISSHGDLVEALLLGATVNGFHGLKTILPITGQGTVGASTQPPISGGGTTPRPT